MKKITLLDDHPIVRFSLINMLREIYPDSIIYEFSTLHEFKTSLLQNTTIDLIFLDIMLQNNENGLEAIPAIKILHPAAIIIVFSLYETPEILYILKKYQVHAFFPKSIEVSEIKEYLLNIENHCHQFYVCGQPKHLFENIDTDAIDLILNNLQKLNPVEKNILKLKINQYKNSDIAYILNLKTKTVENYINRINSKLSLKNIKFNVLLDKYKTILKILIS